MHLDLRGDWKTDAQISIESRMGGAQVDLPRGVNIKGISSLKPREKIEGAPTLSFDISKNRSEIEFDED